MIPERQSAKRLRAIRLAWRWIFRQPELRLVGVSRMNPAKTKVEYLGWLALMAIRSRAIVYSKAGHPKANCATVALIDWADAMEDLAPDRNRTLANDS
jgi:hypothetical protein